MLGESLQDIFHVMSEIGDAAHTHRIAGTLDGVSDTLGYLDIAQNTVTCR